MLKLVVDGLEVLAMLISFNTACHCLQVKHSHALKYTPTTVSTSTHERCSPFLLYFFLFYDNWIALLQFFNFNYLLKWKLHLIIIRRLLAFELQYFRSIIKLASIERRVVFVKDSRLKNEVKTAALQPWISHHSRRWHLSGGGYSSSSSTAACPRWELILSEPLRGSPTAATTDYQLAEQRFPWWRLLIPNLGLGLIFDFFIKQRGCRQDAPYWRIKYRLLPLFKKMRVHKRGLVWQGLCIEWVPPHISLISQFFEIGVECANLSTLFGISPR